MRYPVLPLLGITLSLTAIAGSVMAIPNYLPDPEPRMLNNTDISSLWTSQPVAIDRSKQTFERLPARVAQPQKIATRENTEDRASDRSRRPTTREQTHTDIVLDMNGTEPDVEVANEVATWCSERYRSYRTSDNTYQPYSGPRRQCEPSFAASVHGTAKGDAPQQVSGIEKNGGGNHAHWCISRYRSYNPDTNTYRAFSGEIRSCLSPYI